MLCVYYTLLSAVGSSEIETLRPTTPLTTKYSEYETSPRMYNELCLCLFVFIFRTFQGHILHSVINISIGRELDMSLF